MREIDILRGLGKARAKLSAPPPMSPPLSNYYAGGTPFVQAVPRTRIGGTPIQIPNPLDMVRQGLSPQRQPMQWEPPPGYRPATQPTTPLADGRGQLMRRGGMVHGRRGIDRVPAMLTHGEAVLPVQTVKKVGVHNIARLIADTNNEPPARGLRAGAGYASGFVEDMSNLYKGGKEMLGNAANAVRGWATPSTPPVSGAAPIATELSPAAVNAAGGAATDVAPTLAQKAGSVLSRDIPLAKGAGSLASGLWNAAKSPVTWSIPAAGALTAHLAGGDALEGAMDQPKFARALGEGYARYAPEWMGGLSKATIAAGDKYGASDIEGRLSPGYTADPRLTAALAAGQTAGKTAPPAATEPRAGWAGAAAPVPARTPQTRPDDPRYVPGNTIDNPPSGRALPAPAARAPLRWEGDTLTNSPYGTQAPAVTTDTSMDSSQGDSLTALHAPRVNIGPMGQRGGPRNAARPQWHTAESVAADVARNPWNNADPSRLSAADMEAYRMKGGLAQAIMLKGPLAHARQMEIEEARMRPQMARLRYEYLNNMEDRHTKKIDAAFPEFDEKGARIPEAAANTKAKAKINEALSLYRDPQHPGGVRLGELSDSQVQDLMQTHRINENEQTYHKTMWGRLHNFLKDQAPPSDLSLRDATRISQQGNESMNAAGIVTPNRVGMGKDLMPYPFGGDTGSKVLADQARAQAAEEMRRAGSALRR